jgi:hypothetical protein
MAASATLQPVGVGAGAGPSRFNKDGRLCLAPAERWSMRRPGRRWLPCGRLTTARRRWLDPRTAPNGARRSA